MIGTRRRLIELGRELPVNLEGGAIFHAGPVVRQKEDGEYEMVTIGPTEENKKVFDDEKKPILECTNQQVRFIE